MIVNKYNKGGGGSSGVTPEQVQEQINSALTPYWESGITKEYVDSADTIIYASATSRMDDVEQVVSSALNEFHEQIMELSARTPDLSNYWTSAQTEEAITSKNYITSAALEDYALSADVTSLSAATAGKADAANIAANTGNFIFPKWNSQGIISGTSQQVFKSYLDVNGAGADSYFFMNSSKYETQNKALKLYTPLSAGTAGDILVSTGSGAPVWSAVTFPETKILVDFDKTPQSERAALYAELKALYDGGSGSSINKLYDFYKTVNTWQGQKIDYYTFSGGTLMFGQVVSPENATDQVVYVQVLEIDSAGNVNVVTNAIGASGGGVSQEYVDSAVTILQNQLDTIDDVIPAAIVDLNERVDEISAATPSIDLSGYYTSAQTEEAISAATSGKADAANVTANTTMKFPLWNGQGVITGTTGNNLTTTGFYLNGTRRNLIKEAASGDLGDAYAPTTPGTAGDILVSTGSGAPVWSAVTQNMVTSTSVSTIWKGTQAQYDAIITKDPNTFYIIVNN